MGSVDDSNAYMDYDGVGGGSIRGEHDAVAEECTSGSNEGGTSGSNECNGSDGDDRPGEVCGGEGVDEVCADSGGEVCGKGVVGGIDSTMDGGMDVAEGSPQGDVGVPADVAVHCASAEVRRCSGSVCADVARVAVQTSVSCGTHVLCECVLNGGSSGEAVGDGFGTDVLHMGGVSSMQFVGMTCVGIDCRLIGFGGVCDIGLGGENVSLAGYDVSKMCLRCIQVRGRFMYFYMALVREAYERSFHDDCSFRDGSPL